MSDIVNKPVRYFLTRQVTPDECPWLTRTFHAGDEVTRFDGHTYGCISDSGTAFNYPGIQGFFELPNSAVREAPNAALQPSYCVDISLARTNTLYSTEVAIRESLEKLGCQVDCIMFSEDTLTMNVKIPYTADYQEINFTRDDILVGLDGWVGLDGIEAITDKISKMIWPW